MTKDELMSQVTAEVAAAFYMEASSLAAETDLFDLGMDSLRVITIMDRIEKRFKITLDFYDIFEISPTVTGLTEAVSRALSRNG